jgi:SAM-dependent methyltransferase
MFVNDLTPTWLAAVPDLDARLQADPPAWVVEIACGTGWASIALAQAYRKVRVDGVDLDEASIRRATSNAASACSWSAWLVGRFSVPAGAAVQPVQQAEQTGLMLVVTQSVNPVDLGVHESRTRL